MAGGNFGGGTGTVGDPYLVEDAADFNAVRNGRTANYKQTADISLNGYANWAPICDGSAISDDDYDNWSGVYDGDGYKITDLTIDRTAEYNVGLFGYSLGGTLKNIKLTDVDVSGRYYVGALLGDGDDMTIENCYAAGKVYSVRSYCGGLIGTLGGTSTVSQCGADVDVTDGTGTARTIGGLIGTLGGDSDAINCYALGDVTSGHTNVFAGGLVGWLTNGNVSNCYAAGTVTATTSDDGGLVGLAEYPANVTGGYHCGIDNSIGTAVSLATLKDQATFSGWDFTDVWHILSGETPRHWWDSFGHGFTAGSLVISGPAVARSAHPTVIWECVDGNHWPLHYQVKSYSDAGLTSLIATEDSSVDPTTFEYSPNGGANWYSYPAGGLENYDSLVRCVIEIGPVAQTWIVVSAGAVY